MTGDPLSTSLETDNGRGDDLSLGVLVNAHIQTEDGRREERIRSLRSVECESMRDTEVG